MPRFLAALALISLLTPIAAIADTVNVAVASNVADAMRRIADAFEHKTGHRLIVSYGATGKLYAQILHGAPYDVFLAADDERPAELERQGYAVAGTRFTYAVGRLALWCATCDRLDDGGAFLKEDRFKRIALANPKTAPYGAAAKQVMEALGVWDRYAARAAYGENIGQTFQFVHSGNVGIGFVALSQMHALGERVPGSYWRIPQNLHDPLRQDAVLLKRAADNRAARALLEYLRSPDARTLFGQLGYTAPQAPR